MTERVEVKSEFEYPNLTGQQGEIVMTLSQTRTMVRLDPSEAFPKGVIVNFLPADLTLIQDQSLS